MKFLSLLAILALTAAAGAQTERVVVDPATGTLLAPLPLKIPAGQLQVGGVTLSLPTGALVGSSDTQTLTNKTISGSNNTLSNIAWSAIVSKPTTVTGFGIANGSNLDALAAQGQDGDSGSLVYQNEPIIYGATSANGLSPAYAFSGSHATGLNWDGTNLALYTANGPALSVVGATGAVTIGGTLNVGATTASSLNVGSVAATSVSATTINDLTFTDPGTGSGATTVMVSAGKTFAVQNSLTLQGTDGSTLSIGGGGTLGNAAYLTAGAGANNIVQLDGSGKLPAVDGSQLTNLPSSGGGSSPNMGWSLYAGSENVPPGGGQTLPVTNFAVLDDPNSITTDLGATPATAGEYLLTATANFTGGVAPNQSVTIYILKNGGVIAYCQNAAVNQETGEVDVTVSCAASASGGDTFSVSLGQSNDYSSYEQCAVSFGGVLSR